jgi:hypothetical protein
MKRRNEGKGGKRGRQEERTDGKSDGLKDVRKEGGKEGLTEEGQKRRKGTMEGRKEATEGSDV